jgi:TolB-like protein
MRILALCLVLLPAAAGATTTPAVAVMPFKDLSGQKGSVGEAIRETVTTDLKEVKGLTVIERGNIDKILAEQNLQAKKSDLDPLTTVKVGKLLGATLIVAGAYQRASSSVRLTARFVKVETGEIVGTAKVDGPAADFLTLQDKITHELLRSAGLEKKQVQLFAKRPRPKVKSWKTIELYGDAVVETDENKKREILKLAVNEDPGFVYASRDLDELEKRLKVYDTNYRQEIDKEIKQLLSGVDSEKDPSKLAIAYSQVFGKLLMQRRYLTLRGVCGRVFANPPPKMPYLDIEEQCRMHMVTVAQSLRDDDAVLREGEKFLAKYPTSSFFTSVRAWMDASIQRKREIEEGKKTAAAEINELSTEHKADVCMVGKTYTSNKQYKEGRRLLDQCVAKGGSTYFPKAVALTILITTAMEQGDFKGARKYIQDLRAVDPKMAQSMAGLEGTWPTDG